MHLPAWNRREWIGIAAGAGLLHGSPPATVDSTDVISQQPSLYHGWPTVARCRDGRLVLVYSGGREAHACPFGRVELMISQDDGRTWAWPRVLMDSDIDDRDAGIVETAQGSLLVTTFTSLAYEGVWRRDSSSWTEDKRERWRAVGRRCSPAERERLLGTWMLRSTDGGLTWSAPYRVPVNSPHGPALAAGGRLLYAGKQLWRDGERVGVCESLDDGQTWRWLSEIPARPGDSHAEYHELHIAEASPERLLVHIRNHNQANHGETLQSESSDGGHSWSEPHPIGVWGLPSHLLHLRDGRLLMSHGYRREPFGNQARLSLDQGRVWSEPITISSDGASGDLGYPSTVELEDGSLLTVWYERLEASPQAVLRQARWRLGV